MDQPVTELLNRAQSGDREAGERVLALLYDELRRIAGSQMRAGGPAETLQPTALVHEAYLRMVGRDAEWENRGHFLCFAAKAMRSVLVDHARARGRSKRGGGKGREPLHEAMAWFQENRIDLLALDEALERLGEDDERQRHIVELRFFAGLDIDGVAQALGLSRATVKRDWAVARAQLYRLMNA